MVRSGYKQTDVGETPIDWDVVPLKSLIQSTEYGSSAKSKSIGKVPVLRMGNLQGGKIDWGDLVYRFGYYDQPHFIKEFTGFLGHSPEEYREIKKNTAE